MREEKVYFQSDGGELEGFFHDCRSNKGVVITHPHPLYGGDMHSPVVEAIAGAYQQLGFATLRFNFRGTGHSSGVHDQGIGEQADVAAAIRYLKTQAVDTLHLSGYSFGAWVNAMALQSRLVVDRATMVAPPVAFIDFKAVTHLPMLSVVIAGENDAFAPPDLIRSQLAVWNPGAYLDVITGTDHFFFGCLDELIRRLCRHLKTHM